EEYENIIVRAHSNGSSVRLKDIARVELAASDYSRSSRLDGAPVSAIGVYQLPDANALDVAERVQALLDEMAPTFPPGITASIPFNTTKFVSQSLHEVLETLVIAVVLVLLVVFVFLENWRATLVPMLAVPVALIGTFTAFLAFGFSINTLTLFAMVLAIGLVVDDAIVVVEAVTEKIDHHGLSPLEATRAAMRDVGGPVIAIALVLISVFMPVAFLGGLAGQFYRQFALTLAVSVMISAVVALTFIPALCAILLRPTEEMRWHGPIGRFFNVFNRGFRRFTDSYTTTVARAIRRSTVSIAVFAILVGAAVFLALSRPTGFLPDEDQGYLLMMATLPPAASMQRTEVVAAELQKILDSIEEVDSSLIITGLSALTGVKASNAATAYIILKPWSERGGDGQGSMEVAERLRKLSASVKEAQILVLNPPAISGIGSAGGFEFILEDRAGRDVQQFASTLSGFLDEASRRPELGRVSSQFNVTTPQIEYVIDRERVKTLGVKISDVFAALQTYLGGSYIN